MRWKIGEYVLNEQQQTLSKNGQECVIEPMLITLLTYFCEHHDQIISRQQLIDQVWGGRIVSDSAVNRAITKLRKCFNDDVRQPRYIATFPKKGYRFIAPISKVNESVISHQSAAVLPTAMDNHKSSQARANIKGKWLLMIATLLTLLIVAIAVSYLKTVDKTSLPFQRMKPLTLEAGNEYFPEFSSNGEYFSYSKRKDGVMTSWIKHTASEQLIAITHDEFDSYWLGPVSWSKDSSQIAYLVTTDEECHYFVRKVDGITLSPPQRIYQCTKGSAGKITFLHDNHRLVFAEVTEDTKRYQLFEIDLNNNNVIKLKQPPPVMSGNTQFDLHPSENKLLISSPDRQQWMVFSVLDIDNNTLTTLFKKDAYICCGIWSHDGKQVILMGEHPSKQLLAYDLRGANERVLLSSNKILFRPVRHSNGIDYLFSLDESNQDLFITPIANHQFNKSAVIADTSVDDRLGRLSPDANTTAFISLRSEQEQIWLYNKTDQQPIQLTHLTNNSHFYDVTWSPDGKRLAALTLNHLYVINVVDKQVVEVPTGQKEVAGISFKSNQQLAFSMFDNSQWQVQLYDIQSKKIEAFDAQWKYVDFSAAEGQGLWLNQQSLLYKGNTLVEDSASLSRHFLHQRRFNLQYQDNTWYFINFYLSQPTFVKREQQQLVEIEQAIDSFDIRKSQLLFSKKRQSNTDLYTTE